MVFSPLINSITGLAASAAAGSRIGAQQIISTANGGGTSRLGFGTNAVKNVVSTLDQAKADANKQQIMAAVSLRIQGIAQGTIQPREIWEQVAGFLAITGQPFTYSVDNAGQVEVTPQSLDDLSTVPAGQRDVYRQALERLDEVRLQVDTVSTKTNLRALLTNATARVDELQQLSPPREQWERDFNLYKNLGQPVKVGLSADGQLIATNQLQSDFSEIEDAGDRATLQAAARELQNVLTGVTTATKSWHFEALGNRSAKDDYFLDIENNEITVRRNRDRRGVSSVQPLFQQSGQSDFHIIPEFLKETREDSRIFRENWERDAAAFFQSRTPFHLDIAGDRIVARATDFNSARRQDILSLASGGNARVGLATVNIIS